MEIPLILTLDEVQTLINITNHELGIANMNLGLGSKQSNHLTDIIIKLNDAIDKEVRKRRKANDIS